MISSPRLRRIRKPQSVPEAVIAEIRRLFVQGALRASDRLPPERELAEQLGVGRSSVRAAVQRLQTLGLVEVQHGRGVFLASEPGRWLLEPLKWTSAPSLRLFEDLLEARLSVEVTLARLAARRATPDDLLVLRAALQRRAEAGPGQYLRTGFAFHQAVAAAARSQVLAYMLNAAKQLYFDVLEGIEGAQQPLAEFRLQQQAGHARILAAIERHDEEAAAQAVLAHLGEIQRFYPRLAHTPERKGGATAPDC